jgi:cell division protein FtsN
VSAGSEQTEPATPVPATPPSEPAVGPAMPSMAAFGSNETCPNCNARMAADQRYCLNCGHRRGDPRLPFMDAVVFMESMNSAPGGAGTPPPPPAQQSGGSNNKWNANAALIAGVATLVLAIGVGFLIGRTGHNDNSPQAQAPQIIKVEGGTGGGGEPEAPSEVPSTSPEGGAETPTTPKGESGKANATPGKKKSTSEKTKVKEGSEEEKKLAQEASEEVLHPTVPTVEAGSQLGESCEKGAAGCSANGKFEGNFFE